MIGPSRKNQGYQPLASAPTAPVSAASGSRPAGLGKRISPSVDQRRAAGGVLGRAPRTAAVPFPPGKDITAPRQKDKFVPLPEQAEDIEAPEEVFAPPLAEPVGHAIFEDLPALQEGNKRGRITLYCLAEGLDRKKLDTVLKGLYPSTAIKTYPDVFYLEYFKGDENQPGGDVFIFDYGVVACWGMTLKQENDVVKNIARKCSIQPLPMSEMEVDEFQFNYSVLEKPHIQNDTVTLHRRMAQDHKIKLAISYALSQSTKLSVYEKRVVEVVLQTKHLPEALAETGTVHIDAVSIAKLIGKVFIQKSAVNLLSSVLDTPEFFWHTPDSLQALYERICEYLELETRVEVLNSRFQVLQDMLDMLRDHQNNYHSARLEWIVIWLIVVEVVVGLLELLGLFGLIKEH